MRHWLTPAARSTRPDRSAAALGHVLLGEESAPAAAQRVLTSFAAFDRDLATWKVRLAAMQCSDSVARLALARRTMQWTTRRLDAEISLRCAL